MLAARAAMTPCPDADTVQAFTADQLPAAERRAVVAHAETCELCRALIVELISDVPVRAQPELTPAQLANAETIAPGSVGETHQRLDLGAGAEAPGSPK